MCVIWLKNINMCYYLTGFFGVPPQHYEIGLGEHIGHLPCATPTRSHPSFNSIWNYHVM